MKCLIFGLGLVAACCAMSHVAAAQPYPARAVTVVVPFPAGGPPDMVARGVAELLQEETRQPFVVDHRPGATQTTGMRFVAQAKPDGYTLLFGTGTGLAINPSLKKEVPFDPVKDFEPISLIYSAPLFLITRKDLPVNSVADLLALARSRPGKLNYASGGPGSSSHLAAELLKVLGGVDMTHIPYPGTAPAVRDVIGGHVDLMFIASGVQYAGSGQVKLLGVTGNKRSSAAPDLPTLAEAGVPGYSATAWFGLLAPAGTPKEIVTKLSGSMRGAIESGELARRLGSNAAEMELVGSTSADFGIFIRKEIAQWQAVIKAAKIEQN